MPFGIKTKDIKAKANAAANSTVAQRARDAADGAVGKAKTAVLRGKTDKDRIKVKLKEKLHIKPISEPAADLIQGVLHLEIVAGRNLPNVDISLFRYKRTKDVSDPYVTVDTICRGKKTARLVKTSVIDDDLNPTWRESFNISLCHEADSLYFCVKDLDLVGTDFMGSMSLRIEDVCKGEEMKGWFPLHGKNGRPAGELEICLRYVSAEKLSQTNEVPNVIFPLRLGNKFVPYQDAHTPAVPPITDVVARDGKSYDPPCLWIDTLKAINDAKRFVYIWGWAVWADLELVREGDGPWETLGDILKRKANEGCRVLVMVWDEAMSTDVYPVGLMGTHDEQTFNFFKGTQVEVFKCPRKKGKTGMGDAFMAATTYTHHQKGVLVDSAVEGEDHDRRKVSGFMGGIDLTDGRYDTPEHSLFATLKTKHENDFYNNVTLAATGDAGPREPWHDIHCQYDGPIALDLLKNFEDRWKKQNDKKAAKLLPITESAGFDLDWSYKNDDKWNMQLFRSINSDSVSFDASMMDKVMARKGRLYDDSIQKAYVHHIRRAKRYIYCENQYYLGSCHSWLVKETLKAPNIIPLELCARVERAIRDDEEFRVYICIPMHPEGDPKSAAVQEILRWQSRTMEMMMDRIARAIRQKGLDAHPTDYLAFFCPAKQEGPEDIPADLSAPKAGSISAKSRQSLRYMIYVHSKMAIFDDEYIIVGSANINERSLSGNRDSEMAVGAYQPAFTKESVGEGKEIEGDVRTFRLAVWAEHCGAALPEHLKPSSAECMTAMKKLGDENLATYIANEPTRKKSHLLSYPLNYGKDGTVTSRDDCKDFPDTGGLIIGLASDFLPNSITT